MCRKLIKRGYFIILAKTSLLEKSETSNKLETVRPLETIEIIAPSFTSLGLPTFLQDGLQRVGFVTPTPIQAQAIPVLMEGKDLVAQSQTGSGKTAAFAIPLLARIQRQSKDLQALVMVPTRELALQVTQVFKLLAGGAVRITTIYGGTSMQGQIRGLRQGGYQVVIGTPGRLRDHLNQGHLNLEHIRMLVLDEADEMLDRGFARDVEALVQTMPPIGKRQTALFSATLPDWVKQTATKQLQTDHASIMVGGSEATRPDIEHLVYDMTIADKIVALRHLLDTDANQAVLVFARTKFGVKKLAAKLEAEGYSAADLQGNLNQRAREEVVAAFRNNKVRVLVATNVGARGLDVSGVAHVINFDLPESSELFTHRVGRTGRNGESGTAITFLTGEDRAKWQEIERAMLQQGIPFTRRRWQGPRAEQAPKTTVVAPTNVTHLPYSSRTDRDLVQSPNRRTEQPFSRPPERDVEQAPNRRRSGQPFNGRPEREGAEQSPNRRRSEQSMPTKERPRTRRYRGV